jgi:hypothetical protein
MTDTSPGDHDSWRDDAPRRHLSVDSRRDNDGPPLALRIALVAMLVLFIGFAVGLAFSSHHSGAVPQPESSANN